MPSELMSGLLPEFLVLGAIVLLMLLEMLRVDGRLARAVFVVATGGGLVVLLRQISAGFGATLVPGEVVIDPFAMHARVVLLLCALGLGLGFSRAGGHKFWLLAAGSLLGGLLMMASAGFITLFLGIELLSLPAFALIVHQQGRGVASEGAFKYLVLSSVASAVLLFGVSLAYGATGTLTFGDWAHGLAAGHAQAAVAGLLVLGGLFLKAAVFPLHAWAPDAYASARLPVTGLMASLVKAAVVLALARILATMPLGPGPAAVVTLLALLSIVYGNVAALGQARFKRLLAYSSVAHAGYMIFALLDVTGQRPDDLLWYAAFYALATLLACAAFSALSLDGDDDLRRLDGAFARQPVASLLLGIAVLSLAGLPPFPGFFAKLFVFRSVVASGHLGAAILAFAGSFLGLAYYVGLVLRLFRSETAGVTGGLPDTTRTRDEVPV